MPASISSEASGNSTLTSAADQAAEAPPAPVEKSGLMDSSGPEPHYKDNIVLWESAGDPENPLNWSSSKKTRITLLLGATTLCSGFASSVFSTTLPYVAAEYHVSSQVSLFGSALFLMGYVPGPFVFGPMSELYGRKTVYIAVFLFFCFSLATATAENFQTVLVTRFFAGFFASGPVTTVGGGLADMYNTRDRASAVVLYSLAVVGGPTLSPVIGSAIGESYLGWRFTQYLTAILAGTMVVLGVLFVPEMYGPVLLARKASKLRKSTGHWELHSVHEMKDFSVKAIFEKNLLRPLKMFLTEPVVTVLTIYNSFTYGVLYLLFSAVPIVFEEHKGWTPVQSSLCFLATLVGCLVAAALNHSYAKFVFGPYLDAHNGVSRPEMRLLPMMLGGILFPAGFFLLGWAPSAGQIFGLFLIGISFLLIFQSGINYLLDTYSVFGASAVAANTFLRSFAAACLPFSATPMFGKLGIGWTCTLLGCVAALLALVPFAFYVAGPSLRRRSPFATKAEEMSLAGQQTAGH